MELYPESSDDILRRNNEPETERTILINKVLELETANNCQKERIEFLEKEMKSLKELCTCPKVKIKICFIFSAGACIFQSISFLALFSNELPNFFPIPYKNNLYLSDINFARSFSTFGLPYNFLIISKSFATYGCCHPSYMKTNHVAFAQDIAGDFRRVPLLALRKIFEYLSFDDLKTMRLLSSW